MASVFSRYERDNQYERTSSVSSYISSAAAAAAGGGRGTWRTPLAGPGDTEGTAARRPTGGGGNAGAL